MERNLDKKYFFSNSGLAAQNVDKAAVLLPLSNISLGTGQTQRIGDNVRAQKLRLRLRYFTTSTASPDYMRFIVFRYKPLSSATEPSTQTPIWETVNQDYQTVMSPLDPRMASQIVVIKDHSFSSVNGTNTALYVCDTDFNLGNVEMKFSGSTYATNQIYLWLCAEGTPTTTYVYNSELWYTDA